MPSAAPSDAPDLVDAVIACHDVRRPLARCVESVLVQREEVRRAGGDVMVSVVAHNQPAARIIATLSPAQKAEVAAGRVRVLELQDGIFSPAGPITAGIRSTPGAWVTTIGSDDWLEPGSLAAWLRRGREVRADAVIAPLRLPSGQMVRTPFLRARRRPVLDAMRDHLAYRTAPLGLLRSAALARIGFAYTQAGLTNGSDIEPGLRLWFRGGRITYPYGAPAYAVSADMGAARVTSTLGRASRELAWLQPLLAQDWLLGATRAEREEIATKIARAHLVPVVRRRARLALEAASAAPAGERREDLWTGQDAAAIARARAGLVQLVGAPLRGLSLAERALLDAAARAEGADALGAAWRAYEEGPGWRRALPPRPLDALRSTSRPRLFLGQRLTQRRGVFGADRTAGSGGAVGAGAQQGSCTA